MLRQNLSQIACHGLNNCQILEAKTGHKKTSAIRGGLLRFNVPVPLGGDTGIYPSLELAKHAMSLEINSTNSR